MAAAQLDREKIKPTSTTVANRQQPTAQSGNSPICDGAQSRQRNSAKSGMRNRAQPDLRLGKQAKAIMDEFVKAIDKVGGISGEVGLEREEATREAKAKKPDASFRERMLKNAPKKDGGHIITEKKSW